MGLANLTQGERRGVESKPQVSPADIAFLIVVFSLVCTTFAVSEGLVLGVSGGSSVLQKAGGATILRVAGFPDGHVEVEGRPVSLEMVRPIVESAMAGKDRLVVVAEYRPGASPGLVADILETLRAARVKRISVKELAE